MNKFGGCIESIDLFECSSLEVNATEIHSRCGPIRMLSIDGGHTCESRPIMNLVISNELLLEGGVIILDDYF